jgi:hypothetical protein
MLSSSWAYYYSKPPLPENVAKPNGVGQGILTVHPPYRLPSLPPVYMLYPHPSIPVVSSP